jgi:hypothetical protein
MESHLDGRRSLSVAKRKYADLWLGPPEALLTQLALKLDIGSGEHFQCSIADIIPVRDRHEGCCEERNKLLSSGLFSKYLALCQGECSSGLHNAATREHLIPGGWSQKIDLKLSGENSVAGRHEGQRCVTSRNICNRCNRTPMHEAVLLRDCWRCRQSNFYRAWRDPRELRADGLHETLLGETRPNARFKLGVLWYRSAQTMLSSLQAGTDLSANLIMHTRPRVRGFSRWRMSPAGTSLRCGADVGTRSDRNAARVGSVSVLTKMRPQADRRASIPKRLVDLSNVDACNCTHACVDATPWTSRSAIEYGCVESLANG